MTGKVYVTFALYIAGRPVRGGGDDAERLGVQVRVYAAEDFCVADRTVGVDGELQRHAPLGTRFFGGRRVLEVRIDPFGEGRASIFALEGRLDLYARKRNNLGRIGESGRCRFSEDGLGLVDGDDLGADRVAQEHGSREEGEDGKPGEGRGGWQARRDVSIRKREF